MYYNENAELAGKKDFEGNMISVCYDTRTRTRKSSFADGTENIIVYDECGNILSAINESGTITYIYDKAGMLIRQTDEKTGDVITYTYDKACKILNYHKQNNGGWFGVRPLKKNVQ